MDVGFFTLNLKTQRCSSIYNAIKNLIEISIFY